MLDSPASRLLRFDVFALDLTRCLLLRGSEELSLRRQSFDVLRTLAERRGGVVSKDDLLNAVWPGVKVTDDSVVQCVKEIRRALGADARWIVRTVPGRGYEFMAAVAAAEAPPPASLASPRPKLNTRTASGAPPGGATPGPEHRSGFGVAPPSRLRGSIAGALAITVLGCGGWLVWKQVRPEPRLDQPARMARTYDPRDLRRLITPGGKLTCGFRGCQTVPQGCYAVRDAGGRGLGGKIFCDQPPAAVEAAKGAGKAAEMAGDAKLGAARKPDRPAERSAFDGTWEVRRVGPGCRHAVRTFVIHVIEGVVSGHRAWGPISGTVTSSGRIAFKHHSSTGNGVSLHYSATLEGASGSGTFEYPDSPCKGTITLKRGGSRAEPTKDW
jgi:DNA-binding winged helix-turn-helix (wHTH) protein